MPSSSRFAYLRATVRNHPMIVASTAATAGVVLGGFFAVQLLDTSPRRPATPQAMAEVKAPPPKPVAETTGSAAVSVASAECQQQTWPHLSPVCQEEYRNAHRPARVVSTDKLDKPSVDAIESSPAKPTDKPELAVSAPWAPAVASVEPLAPPSAAAIPAAPMPVTAAVAPEPSPAVAAPSATPPLPAQPAAMGGAKEKSAAKKARRKPKSERRVPGKPELDDDDDGSVATANSDDNSDEPIRAGRHNPPRRIVERWTERDYDVPDRDGRGQRRVTVIHRDRGGVFGKLFGGD